MKALYSALFTMLFVSTFSQIWADEEGCSDVEDPTPDDTDEPSPSPTPPSDFDRDHWTVEEGDCNDIDASIYPEAQEVCNGKDENCDGRYDEDLFLYTFCPDRDTDGWGADPGCKVACGSAVLPAGTAWALLQTGTTNGGVDCNDSDKDIYPGQVELCDAKDNDCNGEIDPDAICSSGIPEPDCDLTNME